MSIGGATLAYGSASRADQRFAGLHNDPWVKKKKNSNSRAYRSKKATICKKNKNDIQHPRFPCSPLPKY